jgi:hypothetical protein
MTSGDSFTLSFAYKQHSDEHDAATGTLNARTIADWSASFLAVDLRGSETHTGGCACAHSRLTRMASREIMTATLNARSPHRSDAARSAWFAGCLLG